MPGIGLDLGNLVVHLTANARQYNRVMLGAERTMKRTSAQMGRMGRKMSTMVTLPLTIIAGASVKAFANFDDAMTQSLAIMGDVSVEMKKDMADLARSMSTESVKGATELAHSYFYLASAGLNAEQSLTALPVVTKFATAGMFDMALATDLLTDAQSALGMTVDDSQKNMANMTKVSDVLVKANTLANATVQQFSTALTSKAGTAMKSYNIALEEGVAVLAAYADQGIKAELAGNTFGRMLRLLIKSINKNGAVFKKMGIRTKDAAGNLAPLADIIGDITAATKDMGAVDKAAALQMLGFQARSQQAILPLLGLSKNIRKYEAELKKAGGITQEVAEKQLKSFSSQMKILWNIITDVGIEIGEILAPAILRLGDYIKRGLKWWRTLSKETKKYIVIMGAVVAAIGPALLMMSLMLKLMGPLIAGMRIFGVVAFQAFTAFKIAGLAALLPFIKVIAIIAAVSIAVMGLVRLLGGPGSLGKAWEKVKEVTKSAFQKMIGFLANFKHNMKALIDWLPKNWTNVLKDMFMLWWTFTKNLWHNFWVALKIIAQLQMAFIGWMANQFVRLWEGDFNDALLAGLTKAALFIQKWVQKISGWDIAKKILMGGEVGAKAITDLGKDMADGFTAGFVSNDLGQILGDIIKKRRGEFRKPLEGFASSIKKGPDLKFGTGPTGSKPGPKEDAAEKAARLAGWPHPQKYKGLPVAYVKERIAAENRRKQAVTATKLGTFKEVNLKRFSLATPSVARTKKKEAQVVKDPDMLKKMDVLIQETKKKQVAVLG